MCARAPIPDRAVISILACLASAARVASLMGEQSKAPGGVSALRPGAVSLKRGYLCFALGATDE